MANILKLWEDDISTWKDDSSVNEDMVDEVDEIDKTVRSNRTANSVLYDPNIQIPSITHRSFQEPISSSPVREDMTSLAPGDLYSRDRDSIEYTKSLLEYGDTLVFIKYPGDMNVYDPTGCHIKPQVHRVESEKLLATGSAKFAKLLSDDWKQHLMRKRNGFLNKDALPTGVTYVLDLTPPDEGDEAVDLISDLSCSTGVRNWYTSMKRCGVHKNLVGGRDDIQKPQGFSATTDDQNTGNQIFDPMASLRSVVNTDGKETSIFPASQDTITGGNDSRETLLNDEADSRRSMEHNRLPLVINEINLRQAIERSNQYLHKYATGSFQYDPDAKVASIASQDVEEYCPIRHRAGIQALLQVIEGKEPKLDSAPKVWTLMGVAKYFECPNTVVDFILSWMLAEPNTQFIETLPEASFTIGKNLRNSIITRPSFAILVSEEALNLASRMNEVDTNWNLPSRPKARNKSTSRFGRPMEDIDEDSLTAVQAAATDFQSRIQKVVDDLVGPEMKWFDVLPEFSKLFRFESNHSVDIELKMTIEEMVSDLRNYVRAELLTVFGLRLPDDLATEANTHRKAEQYHNEWQGDIRNIYSRLVDSEKIMTRFYWRMLLNITWETRNKMNYLFDAHLGTQYRKNRGIINDYSVVHITMNQMYECQKRLNDYLRQSEGYTSGTGGSNSDDDLEGCYTDKHTSHNIPPIPVSNTAKELSAVEKLAEDLGLAKKIDEETDWWLDEDLQLSLSYQKDQLSKILSNAYVPDPESPLRGEKTEVPESPVLGSIPDWKLPIRPRAIDLQQKPGLDADGSAKLDRSNNFPPPSQGSKDRWTPHDPVPFALQPTVYSRPLSQSFPNDDRTVALDHSFFSIRVFMNEVSGYVCSLATNMLSNSEVDFRTLTDTLVCLTHNEFKYLPLWAGGDDDGSGGVFDPSLPPASMGPIGPGPSYHTGFSVNSQASTEMDWEGSSVDTSIAVENGFSDHIDRRVMQSDDGFESITAGSVAFSYDSEDYDDAKDKNKGKAVEKNIDSKGKGKAIGRDMSSDEEMADENDDFESFSDDESWADDDGQI